MSGPVITADQLGYLALGYIFLAIGLITFFLTVLRSAHRDPSVYWFGAMSCLWGLRFLLYTNLVPVLWGSDPAMLDRVARGLTYFGALAAFGFALAYLGPGWRNTLRWLVWINLAFTIIATMVLAINPDRDVMLQAFSALVLFGVGTVIGNALHPQLRVQIRNDGLLGGFLVSVFFFALENLRALDLVAVPFDVEWIGVMVLYVTLGRLIAVRMFTNEQRLAALRQELETARGIQNSLLPRQAPQINGISIAARYLPMSQVAGDIYDFMELDETRLAILIADVSGHGVPAALIASMVKGAFRAQNDVLDRPDLVLTGMNRILTGGLEANFVTASCVFIDTRRGILRSSSAGHPPMLRRSAAMPDYEETGCNGLILGQFPDAAYEFQELSLTPGDRLILYTDGITEAENTNEEQFGDEEMAGFLNRSRNTTVDAQADGILEAIHAWAHPRPDQSLDDDLTLIVVDVGEFMGAT